jgi:3-hydroxyisobutyrate dehydrogenase-like beta-hydroxyacid dehydrogenase
MTLGVKAGVEPMSLWRVLRNGAPGQGALWRHILPGIIFRGKFDPPHFTLRLAYKDVSLATLLGRELNVPMALSNLTLHELMSAMNRGWENRESSVSVLLQEERAGGIELRIPEAELKEEEAKMNQ